jgi:hypothetical protein
MNSNSEVIKDEKGQFIDQNCTIEIEGRSFSSGGAFLCINTETGKMEGSLYADSKEKRVIQNWDGSIKIPANYYGFHRGNMGDRRCFVRFKYNGKNFFGRWFGMDWSEIVRVRECV